jgi:Conserved TM helix
MILADVDITTSIQEVLDEFFAFIPELLAAIVILILGYFVAKLIGNIVQRVLARSGLDGTLQEGQAGNWVQRVTSSPSRLVGKLAFWAVFLGAISLAVSVLGVDALTDFVAAVYAYLPHVIAAALIFLVAGAVAAGLSALIARTMGDTPTGKFAATAAPILVMSIATFMILTELGIAEQIVIITYAALMGAIALGMALAFGLGGRDVAARMVEDAYRKGQQSRADIRRDFEAGTARAEADAARVRREAGDGRQEDITTATQPGRSTRP